MRLSRLIADFNLIEARLTNALKREVPVQTLVTLTRRSASLMDSLERHDPDCRDELRIKIEFFLIRARRSRNRRELAIALDLINRHHDGLKTRPPCQSRSALPCEVLDRLVARGAEADALAAQIAPLAQRASLVDRDFRHICTSRGNIEFHGASSGRFSGLHMADLIGTQRYCDRGHGNLTAALSGRRRAYYYSLDVPTLGMRVMQCAMRPWSVPSGEVAGVLVRVDDVTDRLSARHGFGDVPFAFPDQSIEGTT